MKKIQISSSILIIMLFLGSAHGFIEKRHQWWEVRLKNLIEEKARVLGNGALDRQVIGIIDSEISRARGVMAVLESEMRDDGSLSHETRVMTDTDIASEAGRTVPPLVALHQLQALVNEAGSGGGIDEARSAAGRRIQEMIRASFSRESPDLLRLIMDREIGRDEWKDLALEYHAGRLMLSRKDIMDHAVADIAGRVSLALKEKNGRANARELHSLTVRTARDYLRGCGSHGLPHNSAALDSSWTWKRIESSLARDFAACVKIISMMEGSGPVPLERIMYYHRNPADLDSLLFRGEQTQLKKTAPPAATDVKKKGTAVTLEIPTPLRTEVIFEEMDRLRRGAIGTITGREDDRFFKGLDTAFSAVISRHSSPVKKHFSREEERARLFRTRDGSPALSNEKEFLQAKKDFLAALARADEYGRKSMECLLLVSEGMKIGSGAVVEQYRSRFQRDEEYLRLAASLVIECSRLSQVEDPAAHAEFSRAMSGMHLLYDFIEAGLDLEKNDRTRLTKGDYGVLRDCKLRAAGSINALKGEIRNACSLYAAKRSSTAEAGKKSRESLQGTIAQDEVDGLYNHARDCVELFEKFLYGEKALFRYAGRFNAFMKEAGTGSPSRELERSLKDKSLCTSMEDFDSARIAREAATRKYLRNEAKTSLARLVTLLQFYRKNGVAFKDAPSPMDIAALEGRISAAPRVKIDAWVMTEENYPEIDAKAIRKISLLLNRGDIVSGGSAGAGQKNRAESRMVVTIQEPELSLSFPHGWEEVSIGEADTYTGTVKSFQSGDGTSSVRLVRLPLEQDDMKNAAESWIQKSGCSLVEKRWEKTGDINYLWILARDKNNNVLETCSVSGDGYALLITGKTGRDRYAKFRAEFKTIIASLQMETL